MTYETLRALKSANANETKSLEKRHFYVKLLSGRWTRTLDAPP